MAKNEKRCHFGTDVTAEIREIFAGDSATWPQSCLVLVKLSDLGGDENTLSRTAVKVLTSSEMATFQGFRFFHRRREWLAGRLAVKEAVALLLSELRKAQQHFEVGVDDKGKPFLATSPAPEKAVHLAISHSGGMALGLASLAPCALDFQEIRSSLARVETRFAREDETAPLQPWCSDRLTALGLLWAGKEALRKYVALWPLLGFLESDLEAVAAHGNGFLLSFQPQPGKRSLPATLPGVWAALFEENALAIILSDSENR
ncbi:MAG: hypothetical protein ABFS09_06580 [Thermodesulfobacteriota bacterium]